MKVTTKKASLGEVILVPSDEEKFADRFETRERYFLRFYVRPRFIVYCEYTWANDLMQYIVFYNDDRRTFISYESLIAWCDKNEGNNGLKILAS